MPSLIELNINDLGLGGNLQIKDLPKLDGVEYIASDDIILVSCVGSASGRSGSDDEDSAELDSSEDSESTEGSSGDKESTE